MWAQRTDDATVNGTRRSSDDGCPGSDAEPVELTRANVPAGWGGQDEEQQRGNEMQHRSANLYYDASVASESPSNSKTAPDGGTLGPMLAFGPIAPHYDALMARVPYRMWLDYYKLLLLHQDIRPSSYLDVCCGTGAIAQMLATEGAIVAGIDLSEGMIACARAKARDLGLDIRYEAADATTFDLDTRFEAAYSFFDSLNYITTLTGLRAAIARVAAHLPAGGSFVFDLNTAYAFESSLFDQQDLRSKAKVRYQWTGEYDPDTRIIHVYMSFWVEGERFQETHVQRAHRHDEVLEALADAGFVEIRCFHSYTLDPPRRKSDRVHYAAIRAAR